MSENVHRFIREYYERHGEAPSVNLILEHSGINRREFYDMYRGLGEACQRAGVPVPEARIRAVTERFSRTSNADHENAAPPRITLTVQQTRRVYALMHLERENDSTVVIDRLLDADARMRRHRLSFRKRNLLCDFLEPALARGWHVNEAPDNVQCVTQLYNLGIQNYQRQTVSEIIALLTEVRRRRWSLPQFLQYTTQHRDALTLYMRYVCGEISFEEFKRRMRLHVG